MKGSLIALACLALAAPAALAADGPDLAAFFPDLPGWSRDGGVEQFAPDNLYEHIDGAAENFLACGFELLAVQNYVNGRGQALTAEIYFHGTPENAFAIYGSERPQAGSYLALGSEGYHEEGVLNFISDAYYVKLNAFDLGPEGDEALRSLGAAIAARIGGHNVLPGELSFFPAVGRVAHSERYLVSNFLGHEFLGAAFAADYERNGRRFRLFLLSPVDPAAVLSRWTALDKGFAGEVRPGAPLLRVSDPFNGPLRLAWRQGFIAGAIGEGKEIEAALDELVASLPLQ
jgi:hypothetical protein